MVLDGLLLANSKSCRVVSCANGARLMRLDKGSTSVMKFSYSISSIKLRKFGDISMSEPMNWYYKTVPPAEIICRLKKSFQTTHLAKVVFIQAFYLR